ncbi:MAG: hypothetical protein OEM26_10980 [Saprospiraceae bacterium]|nr:hypothetical protein [Saprospiraceae bacterium]
MFKFDSYLELSLPQLEAGSRFTQVQRFKNGDVQVNCFGVEYAGFPRKIEAQFKDNELALLWILTGKQEEDRVRQALIAAFGDPIYVSENWEAFRNWQVVLRKDKPEVLVSSPKKAMEHKAYILKN